MTETQRAIERFGLLDTNVKIELVTYSSGKKAWVVYGHRMRKGTQSRWVSRDGWSRIAACDTEPEIRDFCAEWKLVIVEESKEVS